MVVVSVEPTSVLPDIEGGVALTGALVGVMTLLIASTEPTLFVPVTRHVIGCPTSANCVAYIIEVAPPITVPFLSHWYVNVGAGKPVHVPLVVVSVDPASVSPDITGATVFEGKEVTVIALLIAFTEPTLFVPVTRHVIGCPTSDNCVAYIIEVAPPITTPFLSH